MSRSQVGYLVPLNHHLEPTHSTSVFPIFYGANPVGRDIIPGPPDKRLSRKHLVLSASQDGSIHIVVEGSNPVVVSIGCDRKILYTGNGVDIGSGDIIELLPGLHLFKYITTEEANNGKRHYGEHETPLVGRPPEKRMKANSETADLGRMPSSRCLEATHNFNISDEMVPTTFRLMRVQGLPEWANTNSVSIEDVVKGDAHVALLSNYMVDIDWLLSACPSLRRVPHVLVIHGESDGAVGLMKRKKPSNWLLHKPPLPISYGTHHSKAMLLVFDWGVRVVVHTANLIFVDWNNKSQGLWMQDFPWKRPHLPQQTCGFQDDLVDYLTALKLPGFSVELPSLGNCTVDASFFGRFDYAGSAVRLVASVPGYHTGVHLNKWGHMKLRSLLREGIFDGEFVGSPLVYQFSSLGSLDEKWMAELAMSMSSGSAEDGRTLGMGEPLIVWPTVEDVRCSLEGYAAGNAIPSPRKNVEREFLGKYWSRWKAAHTGRCRAMPHIKTYGRYREQGFAWFLLSSANLSKAAWGSLQKRESQFMIRSYELGVLFLPLAGKRKLVSFAWDGGSETERRAAVRLPVPYELPPQRYSSEGGAADVPWSWDRTYTKRDVYGRVWPIQEHPYTR